MSSPRRPGQSIRSAVLRMQKLSGIGMNMLGTTWKRIEVSRVGSKGGALGPIVERPANLGPSELVVTGALDR